MCSSLLMSDLVNNCDIHTRHAFFILTWQHVLSHLVRHSVELDFDDVAGHCCGGHLLLALQI